MDFFDIMKYYGAGFGIMIDEWDSGLWMMTTLSPIWDLLCSNIILIIIMNIRLGIAISILTRFNIFDGIASNASDLWAIDTK